MPAVDKPLICSIMRARAITWRKVDDISIADDHIDIVTGRYMHYATLARITWAACLFPTLLGGANAPPPHALCICYFINYRELIRRGANIYHNIIHEMMDFTYAELFRARAYRP